jgi:RNA polymerase sigma-70 factor (ECF subfamily)
MEIPDAGPLNRLKQRDAEAMDAWVAANSDDLFRFLRQLTRQRETAEDLTQQTFVRALKGLNKFEGTCSMRTWLHRIAYREYLRWRKRHRFLAPLTPWIRATRKDIESVDEADELLRALDQIPPALREAFLMYEVQDLQIEEIAEITHSPVGTVKSRLHHARAKLREALQPNINEVCYELPGQV